MKVLTLIILTIVLSISVNAQNLKSKVIENSNEKEPDFKNEGEHEIYLAKKIFRTEYIRQDFERFHGTITIVNKNIFNYGDKTFKVFYTAEELKEIFKKGIFYPNIITGDSKFIPKNKHELDSLPINQRIFYNATRTDSLTITDFEELKYLEKTPQQKRFKFWLFKMGLANPTVYFI